MPLSTDTEGYYILGKILNNKLLLSAFIIPYRKAIYTPKNVIHSDANLIGNWMVVYTKSKEYSSVLIKNKKNEIVKIKFN
jgi:hypothetical protein